MTSEQTPKPARQAVAPGRRHSTGVVIGAGLGGLAIGALAVFAVTGVTWKIRVELPPPPYPAPFSSPLSQPPVSYPPPSPPAAATVSTATPSGLPQPPSPPGPH